MTTSDPQAITSPCIGVCAMDESSGFCAGCFRTIDEIRGWWEMSGEEKKSLLDKLEQRQIELADFDD